MFAFNIQVTNRASPALKIFFLLFIGVIMAESQYETSSLLCEPISREGLTTVLPSSNDDGRILEKKSEISSTIIIHVC